MERGIPGTKKGLAAIQYKVQKKQEQLAALEEQGKLATARAAKLQADIATLQEKEAAAIEKLQAAEKAASREQLRTNAADIGARLLGVFGRGAVAEAHAERDKAQQAADEAEQQAAADRRARKAAETARKQAEFARTAAEAAASRAKAEKDAYGREMYEAGQTEGYKAGRQSVANSIAPLQHQLAEKQATIDKLQGARDERAEAAEKELEDMVAWNPNMRNWRQSVKDMRTAGMSDKDIQQVFKRGQATVQINIKHNYKDYPVETAVAFGALKTAANKSIFGVWFKAAFDNAWHGVRSFLEKAQQHIRQLHPSQGIKR
jgi:chromosome segregation ATPase